MHYLLAKPSNSLFWNSIQRLEKNVSTTDERDIFEYDEKVTMSKNILRLVMNALQNSVNHTLRDKLKVV